MKKSGEREVRGEEGHFFSSLWWLTHGGRIGSHSPVSWRLPLSCLRGGQSANGIINSFSSLLEGLCQKLTMVSLGVVFIMGLDLRSWGFFLSGLLGSHICVSCVFFLATLNYGAYGARVNPVTVCHWNKSNLHRKGKSMSVCIWL